jgi:hypothetical protein
MKTKLKKLSLNKDKIIKKLNKQIKIATKKSNIQGAIAYMEALDMLERITIPSNCESHDW